MAINTFDPEKLYSNDRRWTKSRLDGFVDALDTYLEDELETKVPDKSSTETINGDWTYTSDIQVNAGTTFNGKVTFQGNNSIANDDTASGSFNITAQNGLRVPPYKPTTNLCIGTDTDSTPYDSNTLKYQDNSVVQTPVTWDPDLHIHLHDDLMYNGSSAITNSGMFGFSEDHSGAGSDVASATGLGGIGALRFETGTTSTGYAGIMSNNTIGILVDESIMSLKMRVYTDNDLSDGTNSYVVRAGFLDLLSGAATDGAYFYYNHTVNSGNWTCYNNNSGAVSSADSGVAYAADSAILLEIVWNGASVKYYIDNVLVATISTNEPTAPRGTGVGAVIGKSVGTTERFVWVDYFTLDISLPSGRLNDATS